MILQKPLSLTAPLLLVLLKIAVVLLCVMAAPWVIGATEPEP